MHRPFRRQRHRTAVTSLFPNTSLTVITGRILGSTFGSVMPRVGQIFIEGRLIRGTAGRLLVGVGAAEWPSDDSKCVREAASGEPFEC